MFKFCYGILQNDIHHQGAKKAYVFFITPFAEYGTKILDNVSKWSIKWLVRVSIYLTIPQLCNKNVIRAVESARASHSWRVTGEYITQENMCSILTTFNYMISTDKKKDFNYS